MGLQISGDFNMGIFIHNPTLCQPSFTSLLDILTAMLHPYWFGPFTPFYVYFQSMSSNV